MDQGQKSAGAKALDAVARVVLGPKDGRGSGPADPRELDGGKKSEGK